MAEQTLDLRAILEQAVTLKASDVFIMAGLALTCKVDGKMTVMQEGKLTPEMSKRRRRMGVERNAKMPIMRNKPNNYKNN